jgi:hypothetical protein
MEAAGPLDLFEYYIAIGSAAPIGWTQHSLSKDPAGTLCNIRNTFQIDAAAPYHKIYVFLSNGLGRSF